MARNEPIVVNPARDMGFRPFPHQKKVFRHFLGPKLDSVLPDRHAALVWHRRAGKDHTALALLTMAAMMKPASYLHMFPEEKQARRGVWESPTHSVGLPIVEQVIPEHLISKAGNRLEKNNTKMTIKLRNGSLIQVAGFDNFDSLTGGNYFGIVFSEYAISQIAPLAWKQTFAPMLAENHGFSAYISTFRGQNHMYDLFYSEKRRADPNWLFDMKTCEETFKHDGVTPIITLEDARRLYDDEDEAWVEQEFLCSSETPFSHAIYKEAIARTIKDGRYVDLPHRPHVPCVTAWDIGMNDDTFVIIAQPAAGGMVHIVDALFGPDKTLGGWVKELHWDSDKEISRPYRYVDHYGPHDLNVRDWSQRGEDAVTRKQIAQDLGIDFTVRKKKLPLEDGIAATRAFFDRCVFNKSSRGVRRLWESLKAYVRERDEEAGDQKPAPKKGWQRHGADSLRTLATLYPAGDSQDAFGIVVDGDVYVRKPNLDTHNSPHIIGSIMSDKRPYMQQGLPQAMFADGPAETIPVIGSLNHGRRR